MNNSNEDAATVIALILVVALYFLPAIVAFSRGHHYRWVIFAINVAAGWTGLAWIGSMIWAVFPSDKSIADPIMGNPTGLMSRNVGDTWGSVSHGADVGVTSEREYRKRVEPPPLSLQGAVKISSSASPQDTKVSSLTEQLERLSNLHVTGLISQDEFEKIKKSLIDKSVR